MATAWWHPHFAYHPAKSDIRNKGDAYTGVGPSAKLKVYCKKCLQAHITKIAAKEQREVETGNRTIVRTTQEIEEECESLLMSNI